MTVERIVSDIHVVSIAAGVGEGLGPRIRCCQLQIAFSFGGVKLHPMIVRIGIRKTHPDLGKTLIGSERVDRRLGAGSVGRQGCESWHVDVRLPDQMPA